MQAANSNSALRKKQLTSKDMLLNVQLHGPSQSLHEPHGNGEARGGTITLTMLGIIIAAKYLNNAQGLIIAGRGDTGEMQLLTGRELRRKLQQQMRDAHSMLRSQTAIAHIAAAPTSAYTRTKLVCDPRTSSAILELGTGGTGGTLADGRHAAAALEALVAIAHRSVSPLDALDGPMNPPPHHSFPASLAFSAPCSLHDWRHATGHDSSVYCSF